MALTLTLGVCDGLCVLMGVFRHPSNSDTYGLSLGSVPYSACSLLTSPMSWGPHYNFGFTFTDSGIAHLGVHIGSGF